MRSSTRAVSPAEALPR